MTIDELPLGTTIKLLGLPKTVIVGYTREGWIQHKDTRLATYQPSINPKMFVKKNPKGYYDIVDEET